MSTSIGAGMWSAEASLAAKRLVVVHFSHPLRPEFVRALARRQNWKPVYWFGRKAEHAAHVKAAFPDVVFQPKSDAIRRRFPDMIDRRAWPRIDAGVVERMARYETTLFPVFLRESRRSSGLEQRHEYYQTLTVWYHLFEWVKPDVAIFEGTPASVYDYMFYLLCQDHRIPTLILFRQHQVPDIMVPVASLEQGPSRIRAKFRTLVESGQYETVKLSPSAEKYLKNMEGPYESATYTGFRERWTVEKATGQLKLKHGVFKKSVDLLLGRNSLPRTLQFAKELVTYPQRLRLSRYYESKTSRVDYGMPYVYVALHVQPERSSLPLGGIFAHQLLMIDILSRAVPENWMLYVKEHPSQLYYRAYYPSFRGRSFYDELLELPNVRLVPSRIPSLTLIDNAKAVASANSTACWEAIHRGTPALVFGHAWFRDCEGVFYTPTFDACRETLTKITAGYKIDRAKVRAYMHVLETDGLAGYGLEGARGEEADKAIEKVVEALCERLPLEFVETMPPMNGRTKVI